MRDDAMKEDGERQPQAPRHRIRLPGFLIDEEIGLGDAIKRISYSMGIGPCSGCERRAAALNRWMSLGR
jgi:hypothetical protein